MKSSFEEARGARSSPPPRGGNWPARNGFPNVDRDFTARVRPSDTVTRVVDGLDVPEDDAPLESVSNPDGEHRAEVDVAAGYEDATTAGMAYWNGEGQEYLPYEVALQAESDAGDDDVETTVEFTGPLPEDCRSAEPRRRTLGCAPVVSASYPLDSATIYVGDDLSGRLFRETVTHELGHGSGSATPRNRT